jgi:insertion element IS1 protein InsB
MALEAVNTSLLRTLNPAEVAWDLERPGEAEMDEMWSFVGHKGNPRWLWHAIDHHTGKVLAYVFGRRTDEVFLQLKALLEPFGLTRYYTDHWGAYTRHLDPEVHSPGKRNTQKIERKHLTLRTRMKRLVRKTICFSKTTQMHDIVIGLFVTQLLRKIVGVQNCSNSLVRHVSMGCARGCDAFNRSFTICPSSTMTLPGIGKSSLTIR